LNCCFLSLFNPWPITDPPPLVTIVSKRYRNINPPIIDVTTANNKNGFIKHEKTNEEIKNIK